MTPHPSAAPGPLVELRDACVTYPGPPPVHALQHIDVAIAAGELVAVVGPSGSGKSSMLNLLGLLERPTLGSCAFDGEPTADLTDAVLSGVRAREIGFVFQAFHLLPTRTAGQNVELAPAIRALPARNRRGVVVDLLGRVGLDDRVDALSRELSGGERQRVAIARALAGRPRLLLCDEPTGNLDRAAAASVLDLLSEQHRQGVALVVVTHDDAVAAWANRRLHIVDGELTRDE